MPTARAFVFASAILPASAAKEPALNPALLSGRWDAHWIVAPETDPFNYGVQHFRRSFNLDSAPDSFVVHVTADNRYQLFVNGERVAWGPARGQLNRWRFETVDLGSRLRAGRNVIAAIVWNFGQHAPEAQESWRTGFLLQGDTEREAIVNSGHSWKAWHNQAYQPLVYTTRQMRGYFVVGPGDRVDGTRHPWGWETVDFDDAGWPAAEFVVPDGRSRGSPRGSRDAPNRWSLVPRTIPMMEEAGQRLAAVRLASGIELPPLFPAQTAPFTIPARTTVRLLLDQSHLTTAYPEVLVTGGLGSTIEVGYAESLYERGGQRGDKGDRNEVAGKEFHGYYDVFLPDGGEGRRFRPLWWRTYRYVDLKIETGEHPLTLEDLRGVFTAYPFERRSRFDAGEAFLDQVLDVGWRTARLCAHETFMDCPYYEQLQYAGDTRVQALIALYNSGDSRLVRNAIAQLDDSRVPEGLTMSRAPTRQQQLIPPFSLWWIGMVHDAWRYVDDPEFVRGMLPGIRSVLGFFEARQQSNGSLGPLPWWNFVDWTSWRSGVPPHDERGSSAPQDLQLLLALQWAADLEQALGSAARAAECRQSARQLADTIRTLYWDTQRQLFADTPARREFSQHANVLAVLAGVLVGGEARDLVVRVLADRSLEPCSYYFRHYLHEAVNRVGEGDRYLDLLDDWRVMLDKGLTTWAERPEGTRNPSRSDCHAWSASPNFELFRTVLGIDSAAPGFKRVVIRPFPGRLARVEGAIPHPAGEVAVSLDRGGGGLKARVELPPGIEGEFHWKGEVRALVSGANALEFDL